jgi:hypothetical protein
MAFNIQNIDAAVAMLACVVELMWNTNNPISDNIIAIIAVCMLNMVFT